MAAGRSSWMVRTLGLALARRTLRRDLDVSRPEGIAARVTVVSGRPRQTSS